MSQNLANLEARMQSLVEGICQILPNSDPIQQVCSGLAAAFHSSIVVDSTNKLTASNHYILQMPRQNALWKIPKEAWLPAVLEALIQLAKESDIIFPYRPVLEMIADDYLAQNQVKVFPLQMVPDKEITRPNLKKCNIKDDFPLGAFFICPDSNFFLLEKNVINIGKSKDNHFVINDQRISKKHAQVRAVRGKFIIFDLSSSLGTFINAKRISQGMLIPGDVVSLGGISLIYGEDNLGSLKTGLKDKQKD